MGSYSFATFQSKSLTLRDAVSVLGCEFGLLELDSSSSFGLLFKSITGVRTCNMKHDPGTLWMYPSTHKHTFKQQHLLNCVELKDLYCHTSTSGTLVRPGTFIRRNRKECVNTIPHNIFFHSSGIATACQYMIQCFKIQVVGSLAWESTDLPPCFVLQ